MHSLIRCGWLHARRELITQHADGLQVWTKLEAELRTVSTSLSQPRPAATRVPLTYSIYEGPKLSRVVVLQSAVEKLNLNLKPCECPKFRMIFPYED